MIYPALQAVSTALITFVSTIWMVEETLIKLMMSTFFMALRFVCHPMMLLPMILSTYYVIHKYFWRRQDSDGIGLRNIARTPRIASYRSMGSLSSRSIASCDFDAPEEDSARLRL